MKAGACMREVVLYAFGERLLGEFWGEEFGWMDV